MGVSAHRKEAMQGQKRESNSADPLSLRVIVVINCMSIHAIL